MNTITTQPDLTCTDVLLSFSVLCNELPPSFYPPAMTFTYCLQGMLLFFLLSIVLSLSVSLPAFVVFPFLYVLYKFIFQDLLSSRHSLTCYPFLSFCPLCLFPLPSFFPTVSCDRSDHQAVYFDHSQDGTVCPFYSFQPCPPDFLFFLLFFFCLLLSCTPPSEIILRFSYLSLPIKDTAIMKSIKNEIFLIVSLPHI